MVDKVSYHKFITIVLALIIVFIAGVIVGNFVYSEQSREITTFLKQNELNSESFLVEQSLLESFGEDSCSFAETRVDQLYEDLYRTGKLLTEKNAEENLGQAQYRYLKRQYHLMQIRNYLLYKRLLDSCDEEENIILYYYGDDEYSTEQGHVLDEIVKNYEVNVFAIEYNYSKELEFLQDFYEINASPAVVVDYDEVRHGFTPYAETVELLSKDED